MRLLKYFFLLASIMLVSCEKEIDFEYHDIPQQRVIEGLLTTDSIGVKLTYTIPTNEPFTDATITDALVSIEDADNGRSFTLSPDASGVFTTDEFKGTVGHTYELTVKIGDDVYVSRSRMLPESKIVSAEFGWIKMPYDDVAVLKVEISADADPITRYWLRVYRNGEPYEWQVIESRNVVDGIVTGMVMTSRRDADEEDDDRVLREGDVVDIEVMPISPAMGNYLNSLNNGDYNGDRMFEGSFCLGYFLAAPLSRAQLIYLPDQIHYVD